MAKEKRVNKFVLSTALRYGVRKMMNESESYFDKFPEDPEGIPIDFDKFQALLKELGEIMIQKAEAFINDTIDEVPDEELINPVNPPKPPELEEPPEDMYGHTKKMVVQWNGDMMSHRNESDPSDPGTVQRLFAFPGKGPDYGSSLVFVWSDGNILYVRNSSERAMNPPPDKRKYQPGGGLGTTPGMEVYAPVGTSPDSVTMYYTN